MKKLLLSILLLGGLSASAQTLKDVEDGGSTTEVFSPKHITVKLERVSYRNEKYGTSIDQSKEVQFRNAKIAEYKKLGYVFDGMVTGAIGKFMRFVK